MDTYTLTSRLLKRTFRSVGQGNKEILRLHKSTFGLFILSFLLYFSTYFLETSQYELTLTEKCAVLFLRGMATFCSLIFSFQFYPRYGSIDKERQLLVLSLPIFFFNPCTLFSSFQPPASSEFYVIVHLISFKLGWRIDSNAFIR